MYIISEMKNENEKFLYVTQLLNSEVKSIALVYTLYNVSLKDPCIYIV